jgi:hypothetical protein
MGYVFDDGCCRHGEIFESVPCLPDAAELERLRRIEAAARDMGDHPEMSVAHLSVDRDKFLALRAALAEGSAPDDE